MVTESKKQKKKEKKKKYLRQGGLLLHLVVDQSAPAKVLAEHLRSDNELASLELVEFFR
jgi:hypothetical protein